VDTCASTSLASTTPSSRRPGARRSATGKPPWLELDASSIGAGLAPYVQRAQRYNTRARLAEIASGEAEGARGRVTAEELKQLVAEYKSRCLHCGKELDFLRSQDAKNQQQNIATFDHLISLSAGGRGDKENLAPACAPCNQNRERLRLKRERLQLERESESKWARFLRVLRLR
jgi:hypothetical protein